ncbi:hypothetical protein BGZ49_008250 [Haplosporangium sp. Z 27]|nr:hypothetical protein BGZ49_008250 [Haplosporangium sp. Z 27]
MCPIDEGTTKLFQQLCEEQGRVNQCQAILSITVSNNNTTNSTAVNSSNLSSSNTNTIPRSSLDTHPPSVVYNVTLSGPYQKVMLARGAFLRNSPLKPRLSISISKDLISSENASQEHGILQSQLSENPVSSISSILQTGSGSTLEVPESEDSCETVTDTQGRYLPSPPADKTTQDDVSKIAAQPPSKSGGKSSHISTTFAQSFTVLPQFKAAVDEISATTRTTITLLSNTPSSGRAAFAGFGRQNMVELQVTGMSENAEAARMLLLVAIDTLKPGIVADKLTVELKFQNMIGGRKRQALQDLMSKTRTNIYLTSPLVQTANKSGVPVDSRYNEIFITGEAKQVASAKDALSRAYARAQTASLSCARQVNIATRKLDWMLLNHREKLRSIMIDNATFVAFPPLGGTHPTISVYGESSVNVERTIRTVMQLSCHFHSGSITMRDVTLSMHISQSLSSFANICKGVSQASGSEVEFRNNGFLVFGSESQTRIAMQYLTEADIIKTLPSEFKFSVELANEHREFISGKKNGKINRIMKATGAKIKFDQCNEYNFYVDLSSTIAMKAMEALMLLQEELPAEISFFVPETYHKRIIGVGGKNIQRIMKKYGVYVKFSNSEEFATLGGYFDNLDNVVARTPSKNSINLENLKQAVMELVSAKDKDFVSHHLLIPKQLHLSLMSDHADALRDIHDITNATVLFTARETGSDIVTISGPESLIQQAIEMLLGMVEEQYYFPMKYSSAMDSILESSEFRSVVVDAMKQAWKITLISPKIKSAEPKSGSVKQESTLDHGEADKGEKNQSIESSADESTLSKSPANYSFVFEYTRNNEEYLKNAKDLLIKFLSKHNIEASDHELDNSRPQSISSGESFVHMHNRTTSSEANCFAENQSYGPSDYVLFDNTAQTFDSTFSNTGVIGGGSLVTPDIRALFTPSIPSSFTPLDTSSPRWTDHSRHLSSYSVSSSNHSPTTSISGTPFAASSASNIGQSPVNSSTYTRTTSSPSDPWAPNKHQQRQSHHSGSLGPIGDSRLTSSGYYSPGGYSQSQHTSLLGSDVTFNKALAFQPPISNGSVNRYSGGNSPVQGGATNHNAFGNSTSRQGSPQHTPSQRPSSGSSSNRNSMQFLEEKMLSGSTFGPGYGPSLNSGSGRASHQQHLGYQLSQQHQPQYVGHNQYQSLHTYPQQQQQQQQQKLGFSSHTYSPHVQLQNGLSYPNQRQRHSSQNSAASHHTMGLGHIGGGPGSAGGSVNSDEVSTEDDSDEVFDEMRNRQRMQSAPAQMFQQPQLLQQNYHAVGFGGGYEGYSSHNSSSSSLLNRRGSGGSTHSIGLQQQQQQQQQQIYSQKSLDYSSHLSNTSLDIYGPNLLISSMEKHSINSQPEGDLNAIGGRSTSRFSQSRNTTGVATNLSGLGLPGNVAGSRFESDHGLFSSGFGGIIGDEAHGYGQANGSINGLSHSTGGGFDTHSQSLGHQSFGSGAFSNFAGSAEGLIFGSDGTNKAGKSVSSNLSASATPFYMNSSMHGQLVDRANEASRSSGWEL